VKPYNTNKEKNENRVEEPEVQYGNPDQQEEARLIRAMNMSDMEKLSLFTRMLRVNAMYKKAKITHKD
jgi:hypothetical protein